MTGVPFGFTPPEPPDDEGASGGSGSKPPGGNPPGGPIGFNPEGFNLGGFNMSDLGAALTQLGSMLQGMGSANASSAPVNWDSALDIARKAVAATGDPVVADAQTRAATEAIRLAELWVDGATTLPSTGATARAWSRSEWLQATMPAWQSVINPVAEHVQAAMTGMMPGGEDLAGQLPPELRQMLPANMSASDISGMLGPIMGMAKQMGANLFAMQVGQALAALAEDVVSSGDVGLPLTSDGVPTLLPANVAAFGQGLGIDTSEVELYLALREVAHQRLFTHVPWLAPRVIGAVEQYASGIGLDPGRMEEAMRGVDPNNPESIQEALASGVLVPEDTPEQKAALARLETLLALIEGWVDHVVTEAVGGRLASATRLQEAVRRRRAAGGPAERTFANLVGLELRPRRLREAATLWRELDAQAGTAGRDAVWEHPDLLPTASDLDDPSGFVRATSGGSSISDADLAALTSGELPPPRPEPDAPAPGRPRDDDAAGTDPDEPGGAAV